MSAQTKINPTQKATIMAIMTAAAVATNYMLIGAINIKFMDLIVFTTGYVLGPLPGAGVGAMVWAVYGTLNPYGFSLPVLAATMLGETIYGYAGGAIRNRMNVGMTLKPDIRLAVIGFMLTFVYDLFTNIVSAITAGVPIMIGLIAGVPFSLVHEVSNAAFFAFGFPPLVRGIRQVLRMNE
ncbi:MAG: hypothetical protein NWE89_00815 [Candidatus Bathyarchaeota archaeon]|nr:hypothetical protein [Candidatus Bathyarchaeota archaeon]